MSFAAHPLRPLFGLLLLAALPLTASPDPPARKSTETATADTPAESGMDTLRKLALPGEHHAGLQPIVGEWETELKIWLSLDAEPIVTTGEAVTHWILGGRFVETTYRAEFMGQPFEGKGVEGYDNYAKEYVGTWRDTLGTYTMLFKGQCEDDCRVRTMVAQFTEPVSGQRMISRTVTTVIDDVSYKFESFLVAPDGKTFKNLEITARRKK